MAPHWRWPAIILAGVATLLCIFSSGLRNTTIPVLINWRQDYENYVPTRVLSKSELGLEKANHRLIAVGDIHGMNSSFHKLLEAVRYDPLRDTLIPLGDILTKSTDEGSVAVLSWLSEHNISAVRGNHDQPVIRWRTWQDEISVVPAGAKWLAELDARYARTTLGRKAWLRRERQRGPKRWWNHVPKDWRDDMFDDHYRVARHISSEDFAYLRSLPTLIHAPSIHTYFAHAGLLASDPRYPVTSRMQPLARAPHPPSRAVQEVRLLKNVPQNQKPWTHMHLRAILPDGSLAKKYDRDDEDQTFWADTWTDTMARCAGFEVDAHLDADFEAKVELRRYATSQVRLAARTNKKGDHSPLPCYPSTAVYGHTAARGFEVRRWSVGLDSGCRYGRRLSALVLDARALGLDGGSEDTVVDAAEDENLRRVGARSQHIKYGDDGHAQVVSVSCADE